ncbi:MAG: hypothetical protein ACLR6I_16060 [Waltera sp.]
MKRNKILSLLLSVSMLTALTACGSQGSDTPQHPPPIAEAPLLLLPRVPLLPMTVMYWTRSLSS